jgi:hypothetical protein
LTSSPFSAVRKSGAAAALEETLIKVVDIDDIQSDHFR